MAPELTSTAWPRTTASRSCATCPGTRKRRSPPGMIGRAAIAGAVSLLDLVLVHHRVLREVLEETNG